MKSGNSGNNTSLQSTFSQEDDINDNSNPQQGSGGINNAIGEMNSNDGSTIAEKRTANELIQNVTSPPAAKDERKLFVGGLPSDITNDEFRSYFERFGTLVESVVMFDKVTNRSRGFGFVTYQDPAVCSYLLSCGKKPESVNRRASEGVAKIGYLEMRRKIVEVKSAEPKPISQNRQPNRSQPSYIRSFQSQGNMFEGVGEPNIYFNQVAHDSYPSVDMIHSQVYGPTGMGYVQPPVYYGNNMYPPQPIAPFLLEPEYEYFGPNYATASQMYHAAQHPQLQYHPYIPAPNTTMAMPSYPMMYPVANRDTTLQYREETEK